MHAAVIYKPLVFCCWRAQALLKHTEGLEGSEKTIEEVQRPFLVRQESSWLKLRGGRKRKPQYTYSQEKGEYSIYSIMLQTNKISFGELLISIGIIT